MICPCFYFFERLEFRVIRFVSRFISGGNINRNLFNKLAVKELTNVDDNQGIPFSLYTYLCLCKII